MSLCFSSIETHYKPADRFLAVLLRDIAGLVLRDGGQLSSMNLIGDVVVSKMALSTQLGRLLMITT